MRGARVDVPQILNALEAVCGRQEPCWPTDPYEFIIWRNCGYPASDANCARGWDALNKHVGVDPRQILEADVTRLARVPGGMFPELRAQRLLEIAARVQNEFGGDLRAGLTGPMSGIRKTLKKFPSIADPGVDRILLFGGISPVPAVPSNCVHVLVRIVHGEEGENYRATYRQAQELIEDAIPATLEARQRAFLNSEMARAEPVQNQQPKMRPVSRPLRMRILGPETPLIAETGYGS
jgi:endonuclease-3